MHPQIGGTVDDATRAALSDRDVQAQLLQEAVVSANVGLLVWGEDGTYIAANQAACDILGTTCEELLGQQVGAHSESPEVSVDAISKLASSTGSVVARRLDGSGIVQLHFVSFRTHTAGMPYMASLIVPVE